MASKTFSGQLDQAMNEAAAEGNKILFIPQQTVGEVLPGAASELVVESDGTYSIKLAYNTYSIYHYSDVTKRKTLLATDIVVSTDTAVTTIPDLLGSVVPVTEDSVLTIQGYLDEANEAKDGAEAAQAATEALFDDFDSSVADSMSLVHTDTPSLSIPFNESGRLDYGIGTEYISGLPVYGVDVTGSSSVWEFNKSGILTEFVSGEPLIVKEGLWCHEAFTNSCNYSEFDGGYPVGTSSNYSGTTSYRGMTFGAVSSSATSNVTSISTDYASFSYYIYGNSGTVSFKFGMTGGNYRTIAGTIDMDDKSIVTTDVDDGFDSVYIDYVSDGIFKITALYDQSEFDEVNKNTTAQITVYPKDDGDPCYCGGFQVVDGGRAVYPYIRTGSTSVSATERYVTLPSNGNMIPSEKGFTIIADLYPRGPSQSGAPFEVYSLGSNNRLSFYQTGTSWRFFFRSGGTTTVNSGLANFYNMEKQRIVVAYGEETLNVYSNTDSGGFESNSESVPFASMPNFNASSIIAIGKSNSTVTRSLIVRNFKILPYKVSADEAKSLGVPK